MDLHSGASVLILPKDVLVYERELPYIKLEQIDIKLKTYDRSIMRPCGGINVELQYGSVKMKS